MTDPIRLGFIGCGNMARAHLRACQALHERGSRSFQVSALCDVDTARVKEFAEIVAEFQPQAAPEEYADYCEVLTRQQTDALIICMPHHLHHTCAIDAMEAGQDVLIEKPLAVTVKAGWRMLQTAERTGRVLATAEQVPRWEGVRATAWALNEAKLLGEPKLFFLQSVQGRQEPPESPVKRSPLTWRQSKLTGGGGPILDGGVHVCDLLIRLFGTPEHVYARVDNYASRQWLDSQGNPAVSTVEDTCLATLTFANGVTGIYCVSAATPGLSVQSNSYVGTHGSLSAPGIYPQQPRLTRWDGVVTEPQELIQQFRDSLSPEESDRLFPFGLTEGVALEIHDFLDAVPHRRSPEIDGYQGLRAVALAEAIYESSHCGQSVAYDDVLHGRVEAFQLEINEKWGL